jgi:hypothetical protein
MTKLRFPPQPNISTPMKHADFAIGQRFLLGDNRWQVTDVGKRTVIAIMVANEEADWLKGPPYAVVEHVFDEHDLPGCEPVNG